MLFQKQSWVANETNRSASSRTRETTFPFPLNVCCVCSPSVENNRPLSNPDMYITSPSHCFDYYIFWKQTHTHTVESQIPKKTPHTSFSMYGTISSRVPVGCCRPVCPAEKACRYKKVFSCVWNIQIENACCKKKLWELGESCFGDGMDASQSVGGFSSSKLEFWKLQPASSLPLSQSYMVNKTLARFYFS